MPGPWYRSPLIVAAMVALTSSVSSPAVAQAQGAGLAIANNEGIFIDGKTFEVIRRKAKGDISGQANRLGARELQAGAIIFRVGDKLYIAGAPAGPPANLAAAEDEIGPIKVEYEAPKNPAHQEIHDLIKEHRALETIKKIFAPFRLPENLYIKTVGCDGVANAWFQRIDNRPTVRICYEYLQELWQTMPNEPTPQGITPHEAIVGQLFFAAAHELGHAMYDIYDIPVFGRQEDAADQFSTYILLRFGGDQSRRYVKGAAYAYKGFIKSYKDNPEVTVPLAAFSSDHGSPEERFYNLTCLAYGHDPKEFAMLVEEKMLPEHRAKVCKYEYANLAYAFHKQITPHIDQALAQKVLDTNWFADFNLPRPGPK